MNNYEYILAGLPSLENGKTGPGPDADSIIGEIRGLLDDKDLETFSILDEYYGENGPDAGFYRKAAMSGCRFVRQFFDFDRSVRNTKVAYLNERLGRPGTQDIVVLSEDEEPVFCEEAAEVLARTDIIERERGLDDLMWTRADELTELDIFDLDLILAFVVKLKTVDRWMKLDAETGRGLLRKLVDEIRNSKTI